MKRAEIRSLARNNMPGGAKRRLKFGLPPRSALFQSLLLAVTWAFLNLLSQFKNPRVALDKFYNISKNHSNRQRGVKVTADFMCTKSLVSVCLFVELNLSRGLGPFFNSFLGKKYTRARNRTEPITEITGYNRFFRITD